MRALMRAERERERERREWMSAERGASRCERKKRAERMRAERERASRERDVNTVAHRFAST